MSMEYSKGIDEHGLGLILFRMHFGYMALFQPNGIGVAMPSRRVNCPSCNASHVFDLDPGEPLRVPTCQTCGADGVREMGLDFSLTQLPHPGVPRTDRWDVRMLERSLAGSTGYLKMMTLSYASKGYDFIGFHGCGIKWARSMMVGGIDPR